MVLERSLVLKKEMNKKAQVTIFIIMGVLLVGGILGYYFLRMRPGGGEIPVEFRPAYDNYLSCIGQLTEEGAILLGSRGGYIDSPEFEPGSRYMPFSSQLDFLGLGIPYWFYVSGNNIVREKVPTKNQMQSELEDYIQSHMRNCDFSEFENMGYLIDIGEGIVSTRIEENQIRVIVENDLVFSFDERYARFREHRLNVKSNLGRFYDLAIEIYKYQSENLFLESYSLDVLHFYAPTTGVDMGCVPLFFNFEEIKQNISEALSNNIGYLRLKGNYHDLKEDDYFVTDIGRNVNENINFMYSTDWPTKIEIYGDDIAEPLGLEGGMGILGFCYVPYHFVYDITYPVLIQIFQGGEMFQFPMGVIISKNQPREAVYSGDYLGTELDVCKNRVQEIKIYTSDLYMNPVEANVKISCLGDGCALGQTERYRTDAFLETLAPQCINALVEASAEGYVGDSVYVSTNAPSEAFLILRKKHEVEIDLGFIEGYAIVRFEGDGFSNALVYPEQKTIELAEGFYDVSVHVFTDSSLVIPSYTEKRCYDIPRSGLLGILGFTEKECQDITIPEQKIEGALVGGGLGVDYLVERDLESSMKLRINVPLFSRPTTLEDLSENYIKLEDSFIELSFVE